LIIVLCIAEKGMHSTHRFTAGQRRQRNQAI
jgi:hypothetical protein